MERGLDVRELLSHPGRALVDHLEGVRKCAAENFERVSKHIDWKGVFGFEKAHIRKVLETAALYHDLGKATPAFQKRVRGENVSVNHSLVSAIFTASKLLEESLPLPLVFCGYAIVRHHHGNLRSPSTDNLSRSDVKMMKRQLKELNSEFLEYLGTGEMDIESVSEAIEEGAYEAENIGKEMYFLLKLLFSILTFSDRCDAIFRESGFKEKDIGFENLSRFLESMEDESWLGNLRKEFQKDVMSFQAPEREVLVIRGPTGIGKTASNVALALSSRKDGAVVYALPLINIIEQTADVLKKIFGKGTVMEVHHLAGARDHEEHEMAIAFRDLWLSPMVITTFVSLLEELIGGGKAPFFHRMVGGALILDEVQAIPKEKWEIVKEVVEFLPRLGITVILSTATLPVIFKGVEVIKDPVKRFFSKLSRTNVSFEGEVTIEEFKKSVERIISDGRRTLIVMNTIKSAEEVYDHIEGDDVCFLSSRVIPKHRRERIKAVKEGSFRVCVSTQVVEAGVDISFERVIRDIAPMDSIVQAAGRCNRNFERNKGEVLVFAIRGERTFLSNYVYGSTLPSYSLKILKEKREFEESDFPEIVKEYYHLVEKLTDTDKGGFVEKLNTVDFSALSEFRLIDDSQSVGFLVLLDDYAERLFEKALEISESLDGIERRDALKAILLELSDYTVSTRIWKGSELPAFDEAFGMVVIHRMNASEWYDPVKGLRTDSVGGGFFV